MKQEKKPLITSGFTPEEIAEDLAPLVNFQEEGLAKKDLEKMFEKRLIPHFVRYDLPEFQSLYNCFPEEGAELGAQLSLRYNQGVTNWIVSPGGVLLEELCCQALCRLFGLSASADATFMYCGTYANQQAIYLALHRHAERTGFNLAQKGLSGFPNASKLAVAASQEAHFSVRHALRILGLGEQSLVLIPIDKERRMNPYKLKALLEEKGDKREIFCVVSTAGTTSTGSIDPIAAVSDICEHHDVWHHVDGAYGLAFRLLPKLASRFEGIERADSLVWDPHKQFGVPIPNSLLFVRKKEDFDRMAIYGEYFNRKDDPEPNPGFKSPPSTRPLSALPLVAAIRFQGMKRIRERLGAPLKAVRKTWEKLDSHPDFQRLHTPDTGILCLRIVPEKFPAAELDNLQKYIYEDIKKEGRRSVSMTRLNGKYALRIVAISPCVTEEAVWETIISIRRTARKYSFTV